jgi:HK97 family phage major capsid protein
MSTMEQLIAEIKNLTDTVVAHRGDRATIDMEAVEAVFAKQMEALEKERLVRRGSLATPDTEIVGPPEMRVAVPIVRQGKFAGHKASDLAFTAAFLRQAAALRTGTVKLPSEELMKALTSTGSATGDELVPTGMAAELWQDFFTSSRVVANLSRVQMPTNPWDMPLGLGDVTWYKGSENTATTASDTATAKATMTATEQVTEVNWSYHLDEDSIIAVLPALRARLGLSGGEQMDYFCLNADATDAATGNINLDDADPPATASYLSDGQDGIRALPITENTDMLIDAGGDALADADIRSLLTAMGKYAVDPSRLAMFSDISTYLNGFLNLDNVQTLDKYGPAAVVITGELAKYRGVPLIPSASMSLTMADGKVSTTAGNNTLGQIAAVHRDFWRVGFKRELLMEVDRDIQARKFILVVSFRIAIAAHGTRASATHAGVVENILV